MKRFQTQVALMLLLSVSLGVTACSGGGVSSSISGTLSMSAITPTIAPTATPKPKPKKPPKVDTLYCKLLMSVAEANQIMKPPKPAILIRVDAVAPGDSCNWEYELYHSIVSVAFTQVPGGTGNAQSLLNSLAAQSVASVNPSIGTATSASVTGVGDAAVFLALSLPGIKQAILHVAYGSVMITCSNPDVRSSSFAAQQAALTQVCQQVITRM